MTAEPLWRGKTRNQNRGAANYSFIGFVEPFPLLGVPPGTEVEVWPVGDRTPVTRGLEDELYHLMQRYAPPPSTRPGPTDLTAAGAWVDEVVADLLALLSGTEEDTPDGSA